MGATMLKSQRQKVFADIGAEMEYARTLRADKAIELDPIVRHLLPAFADIFVDTIGTPGYELTELATSETERLERVEAVCVRARKSRSIKALRAADDLERLPPVKQALMMYSAFNALQWPLAWALYAHLKRFNAKPIQNSRSSNRLPVPSWPINSRLFDKGTILLESVGYGSNRLLSFLIANGADVTKCDHRDKTPLHCFCFMPPKRRPEVTIDLLLKNGAEVDARDVYDQTPLHIAAISRSEGCIVKLLEAGADANAKDENGLTPKGIAPDLAHLFAQFDRKLLERAIPVSTPVPVRARL